MKPVIGIIMGCDSDLSVMKEASEILKDLNIPYEITIVSAHRTPDRLYSYAKGAKEKGIKVIIAGTAGAAHLPGMIASLTALPVIGVPVESDHLSGLDSLYSIVQMPPGVPVATVAINGAKNAGILAAQILGTYDEKIYDKIVGYKNEMEKHLHDKAEALERKSDQDAIQF